MDSDTALVEAAFTLGKHSGAASITPDAAAMFSRLFDLTVRAGLASDPDAWDSPRAGRTYVLDVIARLGRASAEGVGNAGELTAEALRLATNRVVDEERRKLGITDPKSGEAVRSVFCFAFLLSRLFEVPERS